MAETEPAPLEGGITNRNYRVRLGGTDYVLRLHGKDTNLLGISREAEAVANEAAAELGLAPALAASFQGDGDPLCAVPALSAPEVATRTEEIAVALRASTTPPWSCPRRSGCRT